MSNILWGGAKLAGKGAGKVAGGIKNRLTGGLNGMGGSNDAAERMRKATDRFNATDQVGGSVSETDNHPLAGATLMAVSGASAMALGTSETVNKKAGELKEGVGKVTKAVGESAPGQAVGNAYNGLISTVQDLAETYRKEGLIGVDAKLGKMVRGGQQQVAESAIKILRSVYGWGKEKLTKENYNEVMYGEKGRQGFPSSTQPTTATPGHGREGISP